MATYIGDNSVKEVSIEYGSMETAQGNVEGEPQEGGVVLVTHTIVDPRAVVVHLHATSVSTTLLHHHYITVTSLLHHRYVNVPVHFHVCTDVIN